MKTMKRFLNSGRVAAVAVAAVAGVLAVPAQAQSAEAESRALAQCVQLNTNGKDRILTARWMMGALSTAPALRDMVEIDPQAKQQSEIGIAALFTRLLTVDCLTEAKAVFTRDPNGAGIRQAFEVLGEIAVQELFGGDEAAQAGLSSFTQYLNEADFEVLRD
jgi:hypothetical protein